MLLQWLGVLLRCTHTCTQACKDRVKVCLRRRQSELAAVEAEAASVGGASSEAMAEYRRLRQVRLLCPT